MSAWSVLPADPDPAGYRWERVAPADQDYRRPRLPLQDHRGNLGTTDETIGYRWATEDYVRYLTDEAYAIRVLDALDSAHPPAVREHDGVNVL